MWFFLWHFFPFVHGLGTWTSIPITTEQTTILYTAIQNPSNYNTTTAICLSTVTAIEQQVVAGVKYRFHGPGCLIETPTSNGQCGSADCTSVSSWRVEIWYQAWIPMMQITSIQSESTEHELITAWIEQMQLNPFGDPMGTMYTGGTPLFDERTGTTITRDEYIRRQHPTFPWLPQRKMLDTSRNEEQQQIDAWIRANSLNKFGDPEGTMYTGGTPLFNEVTGETMERYAYIVQQHPTKPWKESSWSWWYVGAFVVIGSSVVLVWTGRRRSTGYEKVYRTEH